ncbi:sporulation protein [Ammoniphilus sp. YIM 78166]|uniref:sporulation protein n=1 Tax=Ammoniphilus sp. YIM 78166 TaxID=1644106 RepID=UPI0010702152|nr:sporulation protein [Ammoniphilus sp. YIM 78166]
MLTFKKILSTIGIGSAKVHTVILQKTVHPGQILKGEVHIYGGEVEQEISQIDIDIFFESYKDEEDSENHHIEYTLGEVHIPCIDKIEAHEEKIYPFEIKLPLSAPLSNANQTISLKTKVHIPLAPDPVEVQPVIIEDPIVEACFNLFAQNGYLFAVDSGRGRHRSKQEDGVPYEQSFILHKWIGNKMVEWTIHFIFTDEDVTLKVKEGDVAYSFSRKDQSKLTEQLQKFSQWVQCVE